MNRLSHCFTCFNLLVLFARKIGIKTFCSSIFYVLHCSFHQTFLQCRMDMVIYFQESASFRIQLPPPSVETKCLPYLFINDDINLSATISIVLSDDISTLRICLCFGSIIATHNKINLETHLKQGFI
jgi:hypothetical protein